MILIDKELYRMKFSMKKSALALSIAAAVGAASTASAIEVETFQTVQ